MDALRNLSVISPAVRMSSDPAAAIDETTIVSLFDSL